VEVESYVPASFHAKRMNVGPAEGSARQTSSIRRAASWTASWTDNGGGLKAGAGGGGEALADAAGDTTAGAVLRGGEALGGGESGMREQDGCRSP